MFLRESVLERERVCIQASVLERRETQTYTVVDDSAQDPSFKCPGKQKEVRLIINACVPRTAGYGSLMVPKQATIAKVIYHDSKTTESDRLHGMGKNVMIGKVDVICKLTSIAHC